VNCGWFNYGAEGFIEVNAWLLGEPANDPTSFMTGKSAIGIVFVVKNPFTGNDVSTWWRRNESPGVIVHEFIVLLLHGLTPGRIRSATR
jgi:hypothetical protein